MKTDDLIEFVLATIAMLVGAAVVLALTQLLERL